MESLALALGSGAASGVNIYATALILGVLHQFGVVVLPDALSFIASNEFMVAAGAMYAVEFLADKVPGFDSLWDVLHSVIRIPGGAMLAASAAGADADMLTMAAYGAGGGAMATGSYVTKTGTRALLNLSPEPFTNWFASITEDIGVFVAMVLAVMSPWMLIALLVLFVLLMWWLLPKLWRGMKYVYRRIRGEKLEDQRTEAAAIAEPAVRKA